MKVLMGERFGCLIYGDIKFKKGTTKRVIRQYFARVFEPMLQTAEFVIPFYLRKTKRISKKTICFPTLDKFGGQI